MDVHKGILGSIAVVALIFVLATVFFVRRTYAPEVSPAMDGNFITAVTYACNEDKTIEAQYYEGADKPAAGPDMPPTPGGSVAIRLSDGRQMILPQTISASGVRYANADESFVFWNKGNGALVLENNEEKSYIGCVETSADAAGTLSAVYQNGAEGFSIRLPSLQASTTNNGATYKLDESYRYEQLGPGKEIYGVKFSIPPDMAFGTNLSMDSYVSVEQIPQARECAAALFVPSGTQTATFTENGIKYSVARVTDAAAGNRYEETVYALPGTNPCVAVRYFIHYGVIENYPPETMREFDKHALSNEFDIIRRTLTLVQ